MNQPSNDVPLLKILSKLEEMEGARLQRGGGADSEDISALKVLIAELAKREAENRASVTSLAALMQEYFGMVCQLIGEVHAGVGGGNALPDHILEHPLMESYLLNYPSGVTPAFDHECQYRSKIPQKCRSNFPHFRDLVTSQVTLLS